MDLGARAVEEREGAWLTHFPPRDDPDDFAALVRDRLSRLPRLDGVRVSWSWQPHEAWAEVWKRGLAPRRIGERLLVAPTWCDADARPGDRVIRLDPGVAFGTAEHASTRGCLRLLEKAVSEGDEVLDVGAGSGILAIAAAVLGAGDVVAVEVDGYACAAARENAERNRVSHRVRVVEARTDAEDLAARGPVDGIAANIETGVVLELLPGAARALKPGGWVVAGGIPSAEKDRIVEAALSTGFAVREADTEDGWWSALLARDAPRGGA